MGLKIGNGADLKRSAPFRHSLLPFGFMLLLPRSTDDLRARGAGAAEPRATVAYARSERGRVLLVVVLYAVACCNVRATSFALAWSFVASCLFVPVLVELELYKRHC
jgi:hypothetical protein